MKSRRFPLQLFLDVEFWLSTNEPLFLAVTEKVGFESNFEITELEQCWKFYTQRTYYFLKCQIQTWLDIWKLCLVFNANTTEWKWWYCSEIMMFCFIFMFTRRYSYDIDDELSNTRNMSVLLHALRTTWKETTHLGETPTTQMKEHCNVVGRI